jgi:alkanesulfonate monooxygenase SsuD/methylene tetrahydromethanopterin reductase-like flavin-dependent oxidoreductase (luciferase family)
VTYIKFGLSCSPSEPFHDLARRWRYFDRVGIDSLWLSDHMIRTFKPESPYRDAWTLLPALALHAQSAYLGVLVTCNLFRHPSVLARSILTIDEISYGRLIVGMGAGWYEAECGILGIPYPKHPVGMLNSSLKILDSLLRQEVTRYVDTPDYLPIQHAIMRPRPIGTLPFMVGGHGSRMLNLAAEYASIWNSFGSPQEMKERGEQLDEKLLNAGQPRLIERTIHIWRGLTPVDPWTSVQAFEDTMGAYSECGLTGFILDAPKDNQLGVFEQCLTTIQNLLSA